MLFIALADSLQLCVALNVGASVVAHVAHSRFGTFGLIVTQRMGKRNGLMMQRRLQLFVKECHPNKLLDYQTIIMIESFFLHTKI